MLFTSTSNYFKYAIILCLCTMVTVSLLSTHRWSKLMGSQIPLKALMPNRKKIQRKIVLFHNNFRSQVMPSASNMLWMKWYKGAAMAAQKWAQECQFLTHDNVIGRHTDSYGTCGQNIFVATQRVPWLFAIKTWYLEKDNFIYGIKNNSLKEVGHYTQMVWASTHEVGCGLAKCFRNSSTHSSTISSSIKRVYYNYVCNYCPIGNKPNRIGQPYRKGKPCGLCRSHCYKERLCINTCPVADLWVNCREIYKVWPQWLCHSNTPQGKERYRNCWATCSCDRNIHD